MHRAVLALTLTAAMGVASGCSGSSKSPESPDTPAASPATAEEIAAAIDDSAIPCQSDSTINHITTSGAWQQIECQDWSIFVGNPGEVDRLLSTEQECRAQQDELMQELQDTPGLLTDETVVAAVGPNWDAYYGSGEAFPWSDPTSAAAGSDLLRELAAVLGGDALTAPQTMQYWLEYNGCPQLDLG